MPPAGKKTGMKDEKFIQVDLCIKAVHYILFHNRAPKASFHFFNGIFCSMKYQPSCANPCFSLIFKTYTKILGWVWLKKLKRDLIDVIMESMVHVGL